MAESDVNVISHLLNVESEASELVQGAQNEANKRLVSERAKAEQQVKEKLDNVNKEIEKSYSLKLAEITDGHTKIIDEFKKSVEHTEQNKTSFNALLEKVFAEQ